MLLDDLAVKYGTDKGIWGYLPHYAREMEHRRHEVSQVLEIGICGERDIPNNVTGASLWMWHDYFPNAHIHGIDIDSKWMVQRERITSYVGDQGNPGSLTSIAAPIGSFDLIVDDAVHDPGIQLVALRALLPFLKPDGLYVIEDVCPYKLPNNDIELMTAQIPDGYSCEVIRTHKPEVLLFIKRKAETVVQNEKTAWQETVARERALRATFMRELTEACREADTIAASVPLLGLCMIVKNEAARIADVLRSYRPVIDYFTVLDTGSSDGTQDIIRRELAGIPGEIIEEPFVDFASSRNRALELHGIKTMFAIMPNGDTLVGADALHTFLEAHRLDGATAYKIRIAPGHYYHPLVMRAGCGWHYSGRTHECLHGVGDGGQIPDVMLMRDRSQRSDAEWKARWQRDLLLLALDIAERPTDPRGYFYLGQTYDCLGKYEDALTYYQKRAAMRGYFDETFEAKLRIAEMHEKLDHPLDQIVAAYLEAYTFDPRRAEPLCYIAEHYHDRENHSLAYLFASHAAEIPKPTTDLFLDEDVYTYRAADIAAIHGFYASHVSRNQGRKLAERAVRGRPNDERIRANWAFYAKSGAELFGMKAQAIAFEPEAGWNASNPSICGVVDPVTAPDGRLRCIVRTVNYKIVDGRYVTPANDGVIRTRNFLLDLDANLKTTRSVEMVDKTDGTRTSYPIHGFEDARLFFWKEKWWATATVCDFTEDGRREIALLEIGDSGAVVGAEPLRGPWSDQAQKNWMPLVDGDTAKLIYALSPTILFKLDRSVAELPRCVGHRYTTTMIPRASEATHRAGAFGHGRLRGGSQAVRVDDGWLVVVHDVAFPGSGRMYLHRFVHLNAQLEMTAMTDPFYFEKLGIEFCAGLAVHDGVAGRELVASYAINDGAARFGTFDLDTVMDAMRTDFVI